MLSSLQRVVVTHHFLLEGRVMTECLASCESVCVYERENNSGRGLNSSEMTDPPFRSVFRLSRATHMRHSSIHLLRPEGMGPRKAYVTLLAGNSYLPAALVLDESLKRAGSKYPLVIMSTPSLPSEAREALTRRGLEVMTVDSLQPPPGARTFSSIDVRFADTWTKLRCAMVGAPLGLVVKLMLRRGFGLVDFEVRPPSIL